MIKIHEIEVTFDEEVTYDVMFNDYVLFIGEVLAAKTAEDPNSTHFVFVGLTGDDLWAN